MLRLRARIADTVSGERMSELAPRITKTGTRANPSKLGPECGQRPFGIDVRQRLGELDIIGWNEALLVFAPRPLGRGEPSRVREFRKLHIEQPSEDLRALFERSRLRHFVRRSL